MRSIASFLLATLLATPVAAAPVATSMLKDGQGKSIGQATITDGARGVLLKLDLNGLAPGWHAIHFHEKGDCSDMAFKAAGAHVHGPAPVVHGLLNPQGNDEGDLPNIYVGADGAVKAELFSPLVALAAGGARANLLDADGSAIVIHAKADDYVSQPIGGAGERVACGVIK